MIFVRRSLLHKTFKVFLFLISGKFFRKIKLVFFADMDKSSFTCLLLNVLTLDLNRRFLLSEMEKIIDFLSHNDVNCTRMAKILAFRLWMADILPVLDMDGRRFTGLDFDCRILSALGPFFAYH